MAAVDGRLSMERVIKNSLLCAALLFLAGCATATVGSIAGGECRLPGVHTPQYKVLGKTTLRSKLD